jgi:uncharacterized membrane protein
MRRAYMTGNAMVEYRQTEYFFWCYSMLYAGIVIAVWLDVLEVPLRWPLTLSLLLLPFMFALLHASRSMGWRDGMLLLFLSVAVSLFLESVGVLTGVVFGSYRYTTVLGPSFLGLVPYMIPMAWFTLVYPSYVIAEWLVPAQWIPWQRRLAVAALGATVVTGVDMAVDPVMVAAGGWIWQVRGVFFGVPAHNYFGWWLTAFAMIGSFLCSSESSLKKSFGCSASFARLAMFSYATIGFGAVGIAWHMRLEGPALIGLSVTSGWVTAGLWATSTKSSPIKTPNGVNKGGRRYLSECIPGMTMSNSEMSGWNSSGRGNPAYSLSREKGE